MTKVVEWSGTTSTDIRLSKWDGETSSWVEVRRNFFVPSGVGQLFPSVVSGDNVITTNTLYRSFHFPVSPGEVYSFRRQLPLTDRFQVVFLSEEPAPGVEWSTRITNNTAETLDGITVPEGMNWIMLYLSVTSQPVPGLLIEKSPTVGAYFDGGTDPTGETSRTAWDGEAEESESFVESYLPGIPVSFGRPDQPGINSAGGYHLSESGVSLFGKGEDGLALPASTVKMLTAYIARLYVTDSMLSNTVTLREADLGDNSAAGLLPGDVVTWNDLFHAALMVSDNGAAHSIAYHAGALIRAAEGGTETSHTTFRNKANALMSEWGWRGAVFQSASGADIVGRLSTRQLCDMMFRLDGYTLDTSMVLNYDVSVTGANARTIPVTHGLSARFPDYPELIGVKTGGIPLLETTGVVTLSEIAGARHAIAVLDVWPREGRWDDLRTVLDFVEEQNA